MAPRRGYRGVVCPVVEYGHSPKCAKIASSTCAKSAKTTLGTASNSTGKRHPFHFPADYAYRLRYVLTDFMRAARATDRRTGPTVRPTFLPSSPRRRLHRGLPPHWLRRGNLAKRKTSSIS